MKDWTGNNKSTFVMLGSSNHSDKDREINDFYATDPNSLKVFLDKIDFKLNSNIWECACGQGHLSKVLEERGYKVLSTDLINRGYGEQLDFLQATNTFNGDILTNPPFKYAEEFVEKSMKILPLGNKLILFLKIQFLESKGRLELFKKYPLKCVYINSARQCCAMNGEFDKYKATALCYCWFVWEKGYKGDTIIKWI